MDKIDNYYDEISKGYDELHFEEQKNKLNIIKKYIIPKTNDKLLDVGCGSGISTMIWDCKCFGIDPSKGLIDIAKEKRKDIDFKVASAEDIPYQDNYFDYVISVTAIQNFNDIKKGLLEIKRVCKGHFALTFLKKSPKKDKIMYEIKDIFEIVEEIKEDKDIILILK